MTALDPVANDITGGSWRGPDRLFRWVLAAAGLLILGLIASIAIQLAQGSGPTFGAFGLGFLTGGLWDQGSAIYGALPFIAGTLTTAGLSLALAVPIGVLTAIFLSEMAPRWLAVPLTFLVELIAAIPSVVIGLWGLTVLSVFLRDVIEIPVTDAFGSLPLVGSAATGSDLMAATLLLTLMITPTVVAISREVFASVPHTHREAMIGLGGTRWETVRRVVLPASRAGVTGAALLALGRAMGETMAVSMTIGNADQVPSGLFDPAQTISSKIATSWSEASIGLETDSLVALGLVLMVLTVGMVVATRLLVRGRSFDAAAVHA